MATHIILNQLLFFGILILVGSSAFWIKVINHDIKNNLARIVIDITLPFLIFTTFLNIDYDPQLIRNGLLVFVFMLISLFLLYLIGSMSSRFLGLKQHQATVHSLHTMLGNIVFLGFPLLDALFPGGVGVFYAAVCQLASNLVTFTFGIYKLSAGTEKAGLKSLLNINTIALSLGAVGLALGISLPTFIQVPFESLGRCTSPLSMIYIGAMLASMNIRKALFQKSIYIVSLNKLLIAPALFAMLYLFIITFLGINISKEAFFVLILQTAMPCQTIVVVLSHRYGSDYVLAGANLFVSTILSILTLPIVYFFLENVWGMFN